MSLFNWRNQPVNTNSKSIPTHKHTPTCDRPCLPGAGVCSYICIIFSRTSHLCLHKTKNTWNVSELYFEIHWRKKQKKKTNILLAIECDA